MSRPARFRTKPPAFPLLLLTSVACASGGVSGEGDGAPEAGARERASVLSPGWSPPDGQTCALAGVPRWASRTDAFLDTEAVSEALGGAAAARGSPGVPYAILEVSFDSVGERGRNDVLESNLSEAAHDRLTNAVVDDFPLTDDEEFRSGIALVRVEAGEAGGPPNVRVGGCESCAPVVANRGEISDLMDRWAARLRARGVPSGEYRAQVRIFLNEQGRVADRELAEPTGHPQVDAVIEDLAWRFEALPALFNRRPVEVWLSLPVTLTV